MIIIILGAWSIPYFYGEPLNPEHYESNSTIERPEITGK